MWKLCSSLETSCSGEDFFSGVDVWVRRPNVVNRKLVGVVNLLEASTSPVWGRLAHTDPVTVRELTLQSDKENESKLFVRELIPRERGAHSSHELVITGTQVGGDGVVSPLISTYDQMSIIMIYRL